MFIWSPTNLIVKYLCSSLPSVQHYCFCEVPLAPEVIVWLLVILAPLLALVRLEALHRGFLPSRSVQDLPKPSSFEYLWNIVFLELNIFPKFSMVSLTNKNFKFFRQVYQVMSPGMGYQGMSPGMGYQGMSPGRGYQERGMDWSLSCHFTPNWSCSRLAWLVLSTFWTPKLC